MGQYYKVVNLDKRQYLHPHKFNEGLKLMEFIPGGPVMTGLGLLLANGNGRGGGDWSGSDPKKLVGSWAGDRIVIAGDYGDPGKFMAKTLTPKMREEIAARPEDERPENLYHCLDLFEDISSDVYVLAKRDC